MWELHRTAPGSAPPPPPRFFLFFDSPRASKALELSRHAHSRAHTSELLPKPTVQPARAHTRRKRTEAKREERKGRGRVTGGSSSSCGSVGKEQSGKSRQRQRRRPPGRTAVSASPLLGTGASSAGRAGERESGRRAESRPKRWRAEVVQPACGGRSRGPSRGQNEPRAGERRVRREQRRGFAPGEGVAGGKTRIWNALGLRRARST